MNWKASDGMAYVLKMRGSSGNIVDVSVPFGTEADAVLNYRGALLQVKRMGFGDAVVKSELVKRETCVPVYVDEDPDAAIKEWEVSEITKKENPVKMHDLIRMSSFKDVEDMIIEYLAD